MAKISGMFDGIDQSLFEAESAFSGWNDEKATPYREKVAEYKRGTEILKRMAQSTDAALAKLDGFQQNIDSFLKKAGNLCR